MKETLTVVKVGGAVVEDRCALEALLDRFALIPGRKVLVTGGGRRATAVASRLGIETKMVEGRRITDEAMLEVVTMVYAGSVGKSVAASLQKRGINAISLSGADMDVIRSVKRPAGDIDYGFVGDVEKVDARTVHKLLECGGVPVFCPITHDGRGNLLNTNADTIATSVATAMTLLYDVTLTFCFEKAGVLADAADGASVISRIDRSTYAALKENGTVSGGMIPKLDNAFAALEQGVRQVLITCWAALGDEGVGTVIC